VQGWAISNKRLKRFVKWRFKRAFFRRKPPIKPIHHLRSSQSSGKALRLRLCGLAYLKSSICLLLLHCAFLVTPVHAKIAVRHLITHAAGLGAKLARTTILQRFVFYFKWLFFWYQNRFFTIKTENAHPWVCVNASSRPKFSTSTSSDSRPRLCNSPHQPLSDSALSISHSDSFTHIACFCRWSNFLAVALQLPACKSSIDVRFSNTLSCGSVLWNTNPIWLPLQT